MWLSIARPAASCRRIISKSCARSTRSCSAPWAGRPKLPDHVTLAPLVTLRQRFDQYACVRPAKLFPGVRERAGR